MVSTTASGKQFKSAASRPGATHGGSTDLDAGAIWCWVPERGGPSSEECAREGMSWGKLVWVTMSGWASAARPAGPAPCPPWACTVFVGPFSGGGELSWECVGRTIELPRDVDSGQWLELHVTPEEEMAGEAPWWTSPSRSTAVTFVAHRAKSVDVRSFCINPGSVLPSCTCLSALAWWTCRIAMACRAEAAWPAAL